MYRGFQRKQYLSRFVCERDGEINKVLCDFRHLKSVFEKKTQQQQQQ